MRLAAKLILLFLVGIFLVVSVFAYSTIESDRRLAILEHQQRAKAIAQAIESDQELGTSREEIIGYKNKPFLQPFQTRTQIRIIELGTASQTTHGNPGGLIFSQQEITTVTRMDESGQPRFYSYLPLSNGDKNTAANQQIEVSDPDSESSQRIRRSLISSILVFVGATTLSGMIIWIGGLRMVGRPLSALTDKVRRIGEGDFSGPVHLNSKDELADLGYAINEMCSQLQVQRETIEQESKSKLDAIEQLRHSDRLTSVGKMAAGFAHEIGTPLNVVLGRAELISSGKLSPHEIVKNATSIKQESQRISSIVRSLLDFSRERTPQRSAISLSKLLEETCETMHPLADSRQVEVKLKVPSEACTAFLDCGQIAQVITNILINGIQSIEQSGDIEISLDFCPKQVNPDTATNPVDCYVITIQDNGTGIEADDISRIFDPFFTTKSVGQGTGLGLSIAHGIIKEHQGWITVDSSPGEGSIFRLFIPAN